MKRNLIHIGILMLVFSAASLAVAKEKKGPITGTWDCHAHGGAQGDISFTLVLEQNREVVDGSISSPMGSTDISSGTFRSNMLEIHLDTPQGNYAILGKYKKGALSGTWSSDTEKGTWEGKKQVAGSK